MIRPRIVAALVRKDIVDALRESRVLVSLLTPILIAILYNAIFPDERLVQVNVAYSGPETSALVRTLEARAEQGQTITLKLRHVGSADDARRLVATKDVDVAFMLPDGVDADVRAGRAPVITVVEPRSGAGTGASFIAAGLDAGVRELTGQRPPATIAVERVSTGSTDQGVLGEMGARRYFVLATVVMMIGMIAVLAVPIMLTEESEKKTLDALLLVGSYIEVIAAKALVGLAYVTVSVAVMLALTRLRPADVPTFIAGTGALALTLIGLGLLVGGLFRSAQQVYTWSSVLLLPIIGPAFAVGLPIPDALDLLLRVLPTSQGMRVMANGFAGKPLFADAWLSFAVMAAWGIGTYGLLAWRLSRRES